MLLQADAHMLRHDPKNYKEARSRPDWPLFHTASDYKMDFMNENGVWTKVQLEDVPLGQSILTGRWVYKTKQNQDGAVLKHKAWWVIHGYKQQEGIDFIETFTTVVQSDSYQTILALCVLLGYEVRHMDVITAFLYRLLAEEIYMELPHSYKEEGYVCHLNKALYGLKQAPRMWYETLQLFLESLGFQAVQSDPAVFVLKNVIIAVYVDDLLLCGSSSNTLNQLEKHLQQHFKMTNLRQVSHYLDMEVDVSEGSKSITIRQSTYI